MFCIRSYAASLLLITIGLPAFAQEQLASDPRVEWLRNNAVPVRAINPADIDYADLMPLRQLIGDARIVLLGESTHADGAAFLAKTRLIKFLHQEMGFDVLAWESGLYDVAKAWELIEAGEAPAVAMQRATFPVWADVEETGDLFKYIGDAAGTPRPLILAGFDCQVTGSASRDYLASDVRTFLESVGLNAGDLAPGTPLRMGFEALAANTLGRRPADFVAPDLAFLEAVAGLRARIVSEASASDSRRSAFWAQLLTSLSQETLKIRALLESYDTTTTREERNAAFSRMFNLRDEQMAGNLLWLANTYFPSRKIIGWLATAHAIRNEHEIDLRFDSPYPDMRRMGHWVWEALGEDVYVLGFTAYDMSAFEPSPDASKSEEVEFEELMSAAGFEYAIVDFRNTGSGGQWLHEPIISRPIANSGMKASWPRIMDGIFYMREWIPSTRIVR